MENKNTGKRKMFYVALGLALAIAFFIFAGPAIVTNLKNASIIDPNNFDDANKEFFIQLAENKIEIITHTIKQSQEVSVADMTVTIVPFKSSLTRFADMDNKKAHANGAVLVFACNEFIQGDKELGYKLLELLKQYDNTISYDYPGKAYKEDGKIYWEPNNIYIEQLLEAADKLTSGQSYEKSILEQPAWQYNHRKEKYSSTDELR